MNSSESPGRKNPGTMPDSMKITSTRPIVPETVVDQIFGSRKLKAARHGAVTIDAVTCGGRTGTF